MLGSLFLILISFFFWVGFYFCSRFLFFTKTYQLVPVCNARGRLFFLTISVSPWYGAALIATLLSNQSNDGAVTGASEGGGMHAV